MWCCCSCVSATANTYTINTCVAVQPFVLQFDAQCRCVVYCNCMCIDFGCIQSNLILMEQMNLSSDAHYNVVCGCMCAEQITHCLFTLIVALTMKWLYVPFCRYLYDRQRTKHFQINETASVAAILSFYCSLHLKCKVKQVFYFRIFSSIFFLYNSTVVRFPIID